MMLVHYCYLLIRAKEYVTSDDESLMCVL